jgi:hypothetical protein
MIPVLLPQGPFISQLLLFTLYLNVRIKPSSNNETYYFAETTTWNYRVGDLPVWLKDVDFYLVPI